jgi:hypothetical protein
MKKIGDLRYLAENGELVTFSVDHATDVIGVKTAEGNDLPVTRKAGQFVDITVGFAGRSGGKAVIRVAGDTGEDDLVAMRQQGADPSRLMRYTVD